MASKIKNHNLFLATILSGIFMGSFDFFVVNVAAPAIQTALAATPAALELVVGGYAFAYASGLITGGRLGDIYGHRRMYLWGLIFFALSSLLCGLASSAEWLILARIAQGFAAAIMIPQVLAMVNSILPAELRGWAMAWYGVTTGVASILGQVLGGWFVHADLAGLGWRAIFLINVPIALVTYIAAFLVMPPNRNPKAPSLDIGGASGIAVSLALVLLPMVLGRQYGWPLWMWLSSAAGVVLAWYVIRAEDRLKARGGSPIIDTALITIPSLARGMIASVLFMTFFPSFMFRLTVFLQQGEHLPALYAGLVFAPSGITFALSSLLLRGWVATNQYRAIYIGGLISILGLGIAALGILNNELRTIYFIVAAVCFTGFGNGLILPTLIGISLADVPPRQAGVGSGLLTAAQQFAAAAGIALLGTLYFIWRDAAGYQQAMVWSFIIDGLLLAGTVFAIRSFHHKAAPAKL